jgi:hypothetical protein
VALPASVRAALQVSAALVAAAALHAASPTTSDPDGFYHIRHAWVYRTQGLFDSAFPWARFSAIRDQASDLWYGFHLALAPFTLPANLLDGLLAGSVAVTAAALLGLGLAYQRLGLVWPWAWLALFAATGDVLFRLTMLRPHSLSLALALLTLALLADPRQRHRSGLVGLAALAAAWLHLALAWLVPLVCAAYALSALVARQRPRWACLAAAACGAVTGALLRPHPLGGLRLAWIQVGLFADLKRRGLPLPFGWELQPLLPFELPRLVLPGLAVLAAVAVGFARRRRTDPDARQAAAGASLLLFVLFAVLSWRVASRSVELAAAFGAAFGGLVASEAWRSGSQRARRATAGVIALLLLALVPNAARHYRLRVVGARPLLAYRGAGLWLDTYARPGQTVFHAWWDQFPHLFFWSPKSRFVGGMDPLFQYAHDETLFWKAWDLARDEHPEAACPRPECAAREREPTPLVLRRDFAADFVLLHHALNPRLDGYLASSPGFKRVFDDGTDVLYAVQYDAALRSPGGSP